MGEKRTYSTEMRIVARKHKWISYCYGRTERILGIGRSVWMLLGGGRDTSHLIAYVLLLIVVLNDFHVANLFSTFALL